MPVYPDVEFELCETNVCLSDENAKRLLIYLEQVDRYHKLIEGNC